jgi:hypothetical protein
MMSRLPRMARVKVMVTYASGRRSALRYESGMRLSVSKKTMGPMSATTANWLADPLNRTRVRGSDMAPNRSRKSSDDVTRSVFEMATTRSWSAPVSDSFRYQRKKAVGSASVANIVESDSVAPTIATTP